MTTDSGDAAPIRTPDQRLRVFVSSTLAELAPERAAVARAISALRLTPVMFELGARPHPPRELYRAYLAQSDVFVGLYWQRYGWIGPGMDISGLEDEFRLSDGMPRLLYMKSPAPEQEPRLAAMISDLQSAGADSYRSFSTTRELGRLVRDDLALLLSERFATAGSAAAPSTAPVVTETRSPRRSLPTPSTSLIGREKDIAELSALLESTDARLVTLTGPGGIGKTRLAIAVGAAARRSRTPHGVHLSRVDHGSRRSCCPGVAAAVGAPIEGTRSALDTLIEHFAPTPTLLVLDNLEQVTGAATELDQLLAVCSDVTILATSRTLLRLSGERDYPVEPLSVPAFAERPPLDEVAALPAVRLFVDRAAGGSPRLHAGRHERCRGRGDLPAPRRASSGDRARRGSHPSAPTHRAARPTRTRSRRPGHGTPRPARAPAHPAGDGRVELRTPRRPGARARGGLVGVRGRMDARCRRRVSAAGRRTRRWIFSTRSPATASSASSRTTSNPASACS